MNNLLILDFYRLILDIDPERVIGVKADDFNFLYPVVSGPQQQEQNGCHQKPDQQTLQINLILYLFHGSSLDPLYPKRKINRSLDFPLLDQAGVISAEIRNTTLDILRIFSKIDHPFLVLSDPYDNFLLGVFHGFICSSVNGFKGFAIFFNKIGKKISKLVRLEMHDDRIQPKMGESLFTQFHSRVISSVFKNKIQLAQLDPIVFEFWNIKTVFILTIPVADPLLEPSSICPPGYVHELTEGIRMRFRIFSAVYIASI